MHTTTVVTGTSAVANAIVQAFGLDHVRKLVLTIEAKEIVTLDVERFVRDDELNNVRLVIEQYNLRAEPAVEDITEIGDEWESSQIVRHEVKAD